MKVFIDAGYYIGKALEYYAPFLDDSWTIYAFEPNEELGVEGSLAKLPFKVNWIKQAVWVKDEELDFRLPEREDAAHLDSVMPSESPKVRVKAIDFSRFIKELPDDAVIVCSMDIEGAEYPVLRKMLSDGTAKRLTLLDIEFHHRLLNGEDEASSSSLRQELEAEGVLVKLKLAFS